MTELEYIEDILLEYLDERKIRLVNCIEWVEIDILGDLILKKVESRLSSFDIEFLTTTVNNDFPFYTVRISLKNKMND